MSLYVTRPRRDEVRIGRGLPSDDAGHEIGRGLPLIAECLALVLLWNFGTNVIDFEFS